MCSQGYAARLLGVFSFFAVVVSLPIASTTYDAPDELGLCLLASTIGGMAVVSAIPRMQVFIRNGVLLIS
jgi:hypothetical protein